MFTQLELKCCIAAASAKTDRTERLQEAIKIGVGFHKKWYRSQKEHWLGWIVAKEREALKRGSDPCDLTAKQRWTTLHCIPMMFWLAEVIETPNKFLKDAENAAGEAAKIKGCDCPRHGKIMRQIIPVELLEQHLASAPRVDIGKANAAGIDAFEYLASKRPKYRKLKIETDKIYDEWLKQW